MTALLLQLGVILLGLFLAGRLAHQVRLSIVPLYIAAGIGLSNWVEHSIMVEFCSLMGVIFLLFYMGLDFSLSAFVRQWRSVFVGGTIDLFINFSLGIGLGVLLGFTVIETMFLGGIMYMSSSAIVAKSLIELKRVANLETETILGIMVYEDLFIAFYLAILSGIAFTGTLEAEATTIAVAKGLGFCGGFFALAYIGRRWFDRLLDQSSSELFLLLVFSIVLLSASGALAFGLSEALGAFLIGMVVAETRQRTRAHEVFLPFQQFFAALFFVSFGMEIDIWAFADVWVNALILCAAATTGKLLAGYLAGRWQGLPRPACWSVGFAMVAKGEFSIILAGVAAPIARPETHFEAMIALFVLLMSIIGPTLMKESDTITATASRLSARLRRSPTEPEPAA